MKKLENGKIYLIIHCKMSNLYLGNLKISELFLGSTPVGLENQAYHVGMYAFGGIIIKLDGTEPYYTGGIVCALNDAYAAPSPPYTIWGCSGTTIGTSAAVGTGGTNTTAILAGCATRPILASLADAYTEGGYSDWVLPSEGELDLISDNYLLIPNLSFTQAYATSTEGATVSTQFRLRYINDIKVSRSKSDTTSSQRIRAIRYFTIP
jgi:hypothetical protein